jgi:nicotinamide-nucleotide amidase
MAAGARKVLGADWGIATTGVAGPEPQDGQPVGTVFVAVEGPVGKGKVVALRLNGGRAEIRMESVRRVLALLSWVLTEEASGELLGNTRAQDTERNGGI